MLEREEHSIKYPFETSQLWPDEGDSLDVFVLGWHLPVQFPITFIRRSGDNSWGLVDRILHNIINEKGRLCKDDRTGHMAQLSLEAEPMSGTYQFVPIGTLYRVMSAFNLLYARCAPLFLEARA